MDSFKVYLPSNACQLIYPNNNASDYKTRFDQPIQLDGDWEVGVESIFYTSHIEKSKKNAEIECNAKTYNRFRAGTNKFDFLLEKKEKWKGISGIFPTTFESEANNIAGVLKTLNSMNAQIVKGSSPLFVFSKNSYEINVDNLYVEITSSLANLLGYGNKTVFEKSGQVAINGNETLVEKNDQTAKGNKPSVAKKLTKEDYLLKYFYPDAQSKIKRIEIKAPGTKFIGTNSQFFHLWMSTTLNFRQLSGRFKDKKFGVKSREDYTIAFSPDFEKVIGHDSPIIGGGGGKKFIYGKREVDFAKAKSTDHWYIDIYSTEVEFIKTVNHHHFSVYISPWQRKTIKETMFVANKLVQRRLKEKLNKMYNPRHHLFKLSLNGKGYSKLKLGNLLQVKFSPNLRFMYGINEEVLRTRTTNGMRYIGDLIYRGQQLFLLSNIAKPTGYGQQHLQILQSFLHEPKTPQITEQRFDPIVYLPLMTNYADMIQLQLTDSDYNPVTIPDYQTVVCLYFRKVSEKTFVYQ